MKRTNRINKAFRIVHDRFKENIIPYTLSVILGILFLISLMVFLRQSKTYPEVVMLEHIQKLSSIFDMIHKDTKIIGFEHQKNYIDFLTVRSFVGSEVGAMNVTYPDKWAGPYLNDNPTIQEKQYQIVRTKTGYFIVPGEGVTLINGKVIGKDIIFDENANIEEMMRDPEQLQYQGKALAAKLSVVPVSGEMVVPSYLVDDEQ